MKKFRDYIKEFLIPCNKDLKESMFGNNSISNTENTLNNIFAEDILSNFTYSDLQKGSLPIISNNISFEDNGININTGSLQLLKKNPIKNTKETLKNYNHLRLTGEGYRHSFYGLKYTTFVELTSCGEVSPDLLTKSVEVDAILMDDIYNIKNIKSIAKLINIENDNEAHRGVIKIDSCDFTPVTKDSMLYINHINGVEFKNCIFTGKIYTEDCREDGYFDRLFKDIDFSKYKFDTQTNNYKTVSELLNNLNSRGVKQGREKLDINEVIDLSDEAVEIKGLKMPNVEMIRYRANGFMLYLYKNAKSPYTKSIIRDSIEDQYVCKYNDWNYYIDIL